MGLKNILQVSGTVVTIFLLFGLERSNGALTLLIFTNNYEQHHTLAATESRALVGQKREEIHLYCTETLLCCLCRPLMVIAVYCAGREHACTCRGVFARACYAHLSHTRTLSLTLSHRV